MSESSDEGQRVNRNSWAVGPVKLCCSIWETSNKPASDRTWLWAVAVSWGVVSGCERTFPMVDDLNTHSVRSRRSSRACCSQQRGPSWPCAVRESHTRVFS